MDGETNEGLAAIDRFPARDRDLFLPLDPENLARAWDAREASGLSLWARDEPLDMPRDLDLASRVVERRALVRATHDNGLLVDRTLVMGQFEFDTEWLERRTFTSLATHAEALRRLLGKGE